MTPPVARVVVDGHAARVFAPFALREVVKAVPGRTWDASMKCWLVPVEMVDVTASALRAARCTVYLTHPDGTAWTSGRPAGRRDDPGDGWAERLLAAVGPERAEMTYRALSRVLHPDTDTGDGRLMQELNTARAARRSTRSPR